jgi:hypothetical protein
MTQISDYQLVILNIMLSDLIISEYQDTSQMGGNGSCQSEKLTTLII